MGDYTSLAIGSARGLVVYLSTLFYMKRKEKQQQNATSSKQAKLLSTR